MTTFRKLRLSTRLENTLCALFFMHYLQMMKQKVYLLRENLDQLSKPNICFNRVSIATFDSQQTFVGLEDVFNTSSA